ncbi:hypothetical protein AX15_005297 [Amanita polypyramis BW_CC]|nr:hypothetical protein AX15_005297 [Amanita polypyramis BW_CC]
MSENVLVIGGSRNIGYHTAVRLLASEATITFLLPSISVFDGDETIQGYVKSGKACLVEGDGLIKADVKRAWEESGRDRPVDTVVFAVRGRLKFHVIKGAQIDPPNLCTLCLQNVLATMPKTGIQHPKLVVVTSAGLTPTLRKSLPPLVRPLYSYLLPQPHKDKIGTECLLFHCMGRKWPAEEVPEPGEDIMGPTWANRKGIPEFGSYTNVLIVRPVLSTDGKCVADEINASGNAGKKPYKVGGDEVSGYTVSRRDVAHFIADDVLKNWDQYRSTIVTVAY